MVGNANQCNTYLPAADATTTKQQLLAVVWYGRTYAASTSQVTAGLHDLGI